MIVWDVGARRGVETLAGHAGEITGLRDQPRRPHALHAPASTARSSSGTSPAPAGSAAVRFAGPPTGREPRSPPRAEPRRPRCSRRPQRRQRRPDRRAHATRARGFSAVPDGPVAGMRLRAGRPRCSPSAARRLPRPGRRAPGESSGGLRGHHLDRRHARLQRRRAADGDGLTRRRVRCTALRSGRPVGPTVRWSPKQIAAVAL